MSVGFFSRYPLTWRSFLPASHYFRISRCFTTNADETSSVEEQETQDTLSTEKTIVKSYKVSQGGDINTVNLLGTVIGVKFFPMQSKPEREWSVIFLHTRLLRPGSSDSTEENTSSDAPPSYSSTSSRVHVFDPRILAHARRVKTGDRLFVNGFLSYYTRPSHASYAADGHVPKLCAVVAQRMVFMGHAPCSSVDDLEDSTDSSLE
ncbi:hypothetical protein EG68_11129 [Paragonimus skrjabini miyazakii]|uniref:Uncharacterized protein n=1 Tax=Paragonimus skrjabini miyazakii TaxID=59628 RepID=A0A8S9YR01_9TREM|nr:hypothetical protein EG68_11129 [Paragonimus skrjabini miyazakii]